MKTTSHLSSINTISYWFSRTPQNIRKTYKVKNPQAYRVIDIGSYVLENNISEQELEIVVESILKLRGANGK